MLYSHLSQAFPTKPQTKELGSIRCRHSGFFLAIVLGIVGIPAQAQAVSVSVHFCRELIIQAEPPEIPKRGGSRAFIERNL